jgi:AAA+ ATPase superfamily predicted ATPase
MPKINPFRPNSPVNPGTFVGRLNESDKLENHLLQTQAGRPVNFLLTGERGIGKTSLLVYLKYIATGAIPLQERNLSFLVVETDIDEVVDQLALVKKVELGLRKELAKTEKARQFLADAWKFLQRLEGGGFSLKPQDRKDHDLIVEEFGYSLAETVERITSAKPDDTFSKNYDGLLLLIDEADNSSDDLRLGSFLKLLLERLQKNGCNHVMVGLAGLPEVRNVLVNSHPSSLRIFEELPLGRLTDAEVEDVIELCLERANKENADQTSITPSAKRKLVDLSEGFPHFIQQFGYCAFEIDKDGQIDDTDVANAAFGPRGGLELIGDCYYRTDFYNKIQKESYRQVLRIMAEKQDAWITKSEIKRKFSGTEATLDNAIHALRNRHIILSREGHRGVYRLQHRGFAMWIKLYATNIQPVLGDDTGAVLPGES